MNWWMKRYATAKNSIARRGIRPDADEEIGKRQAQRQAPDDRAKGGDGPEYDQDDRGGQADGRRERSEAAEVSGGGLDDQRHDERARKDAEPDPGAFSQDHRGETDSIGPRTDCGLVLAQT